MQIEKAYPAITTGPSVFLRQFRVCEIVERDGGKYRKVTRVLQSQYRGCTADGDAIQISTQVASKKLAEMVLNFLNREE